MQRRGLGAALAAVLIAVSVLTLRTALDRAPPPTPQEGEHDIARQPRPDRHHPARPRRQHPGRRRPRRQGDRGRQVHPGEAVEPAHRLQPQQHLRLRQGDRRDRHDLRAAAQRPGHRAAQGGRRQHLVAGQFRNVNGVAGGFLVKLDPVTGGKVTSFNAAPNGMVYDIHLTAARSTSAGTFTKMRSLVRTNFAHGQRDHRPVARRRRALHRGGHRHHPGHAPRRHARRQDARRPRQLHLRSAGRPARTSPSSTSTAPPPRSARGSPTSTATASAPRATTPTSATSTSRRTAATSASSRPAPTARRPACATRRPAGRPPPPAPPPRPGSTTPAATRSARSPITGAAMYVGRPQPLGEQRGPAPRRRAGPGSVDRHGHRRPRRARAASRSRGTPAASAASPPGG